MFDTGRWLLTICAEDLVDPALTLRSAGVSGRTDRRIDRQFFPQMIITALIGNAVMEAEEDRRPELEIDAFDSLSFFWLKD